MRAIIAITVAVLAGCLFVPVQTMAKDAEVKYKTVEAKHFDRTEGVELMPEFSDYLYAELRAQLARTKMFGQVIGEGEVVDDSDAPASVVVTGTLTEYKKGNVLKARLIGYGAGNRSLKLQVDLVRRSDRKSLGSLKVQVKAQPNMNERILAVEAAKQIATEIKNSLKHESD